MSDSIKSMSLAVPQSGSIESYMQSAYSIPMLTAQREHDLATRLFNEDNLQAAQELIMSHLRFVIHIAKGYAGYGLPQADLVQEGNVGLMKAVKRFNPEVGVRLVSFAVHWIKAEMHEFILRNWRIVKVATTKAQRKLFFNLRSAKKSLGWLSAAETQAIAADLGVDEAEVQRMEGRLSSRDIAFDLPTDADDEDAWQSPQAYLDDVSTDPARCIEAEDSARDGEDRLRSALSSLDERSRNIVTQRWLAEQKATLHELAAEYGVSAERIRQLEVNAMKKLKMTLVV